MTTHMITLNRGRVIMNHTLILLTIITLSFLSDVYAQETASDDYYNEIDSYVRYLPSRSTESQSGKVQITESEFKYDYQFKAFNQLPIELLVKSQYIGINNSTAFDLPAHLTGVTTGIETAVPLFNIEKAYFHVDVRPSFFSDEWTFRSSDFRIPSRYSVIYKLNDRWIFIGGVAVYPRYQDSVAPIVGFIYKASDKLTFDMVPERYNVSYALTDKSTLFIEGGDSFNEFNVTRDNTKNVILRYTEAHLGGGIRHKINRYIEASLSAGEIFDNKLKYRDTGEKIKLKNCPYIEFRIQIKI